MRADVERLRAAASRFDQVASEGSAVARSAQAVSSMTGAFGILCAPIGAGLMPVVFAGASVSRRAMDAHQMLANGTRRYADLIETTDGQVARDLDRIAWALS